jgi:hypothetical protein
MQSLDSAVDSGLSPRAKPTPHLRGYFQPELSKLAGDLVVGGCSWLIRLRSDWANQKQVASLTAAVQIALGVLRLALSAYFFGAPLTYPIRPPSPEGTA